jgi:hypothetical protein
MNTCLSPRSPGFRFVLGKGYLHNWPQIKTLNAFFWLTFCDKYCHTHSFGRIPKSHINEDTQNQHSGKTKPYASREVPTLSLYPSFVLLSKANYARQQNFSGLRAVTSLTEGHRPLSILGHTGWGQCSSAQIIPSLSLWPEVPLLPTTVIVKNRKTMNCHGVCLETWGAERLTLH